MRLAASTVFIIGIVLLANQVHGLGPFICLYVETCGKTKVSFGGGYPLALALRKADGTQDGKIVVAGKFGLARFNADGTFDDTFGNAGIVDSQNNLAYAVAIEANGDVVAAGTDLDDFVVEIYKPNGKRCSATNTDFKGDIDEALATTIQPDGMILVLGHACSASAANRVRAGSAHQ